MGLQEFITSLKKVFSWLLVLLLAWIVISLFYSLATMGPGPIDRRDRDFQRVAGLFPGQDIILVDSYTMSGSWAGDTEKAFMVTVSPTAMNAFVEISGAIRGDRLPEDWIASVEFVTENIGMGQLDWMPPSPVLLGPDYYLYPFRNGVEQGYVDSAFMLLLHPDSNSAIYTQLKM